MEITATRTLVKSAPELWELLYDEPQLRHWSVRLCKGDGQVEILESDPGRLLVWRSEGAWTAVVEVSLAEKGFGTHVAISAEADEHMREAILVEILDELAQPQRRPFSAV
jgi:uncharacterized protein YndB with AHSA1/START domain